MKIIIDFAPDGCIENSDYSYTTRVQDVIVILRREAPQLVSYVANGRGVGKCVFRICLQSKLTEKF